MARETQTDRLNRIEDKLDKLSEAIISLARAEEKISHVYVWSRFGSFYIIF